MPSVFHCLPRQHIIHAIKSSTFKDYVCPETLAKIISSVELYLCNHSVICIKTRNLNGRLLFCYEKCSPSNLELEHFRSKGYVSQIYKHFSRPWVWVPSAPTLPTASSRQIITPDSTWEPHGQGTPWEIKYCWLLPSQRRQQSATATRKHHSFQPGMVLTEHFWPTLCGENWVLLPRWGQQLCWLTLSSKYMRKNFLSDKPTAGQRQCGRSGRAVLRRTLGTWNIQASLQHKGTHSASPPTAQI